MAMAKGPADFTRFTTKPIVTTGVRNGVRAGSANFSSAFKMKAATIASPLKTSQGRRTKSSFRVRASFAAEKP
jgi:hypothetical protein